MMNSHLNERALEALAHDRADLVDDAERAHLEGCELCQEGVSALRGMSDELSLAMRSELPLDFDLDAVVSAAMASAYAADASLQPAPRPIRVPAAPPEQAPAFSGPTRGSWAVAACLGLLVSVTAGLGSSPSISLPSVGSAVDLLKVARTLFSAIDSALVARLPGGWGFVMVAALMLFAMLALPLTRLVTRGMRPHFPLATLSTLGVCLMLCTGSAHALEFEGEFSDKELVSIDITQKPASEALRRLTASAGLGLVATLPTDPTVSLRVRQAPLRDVLAAVLGDAPVVVKREGKLLIVRPISAQSPAQPVAPAAPTPPDAPAPPGVEGSEPSGVTAPMVPKPPTPPSPPSSSAASGRRRAADRVTFGGSTVIHKNERVKDCVTLGGHATVYGVVEGDVVVMGGRVDIKEGAEVYGEIVAVGGSIHTDPGAILHNGAKAPPAASEASGNAPPQAGADTQVAKSDEEPEETEEPEEEEEEEEEEEKTEHRFGPVVVSGDHDDHDRHSDEDDEGFLSSTLSSLSRHALLFVLGLVLLGAFPRRAGAVHAAILESPLRAGALGVLASLAAVVLCVLLVITIIGIPAGIVLALGSALAAYAGLAITAWTVGGVLPFPPLRGHPIRELGAGVVLLFLSSRVPVLGAIILGVACAVGLGAIVRTRFAEPPPAPPPPDVVPPMDPLTGQGGTPSAEIL